MCQPRAVKIDRSYEYLQHLTRQNLGKTLGGPFEAPIFARGDTTSSPTVVQHSGQLNNNITAAITEYMVAGISSLFRTRYVVRELQSKTSAELDQHCRSHRKNYHARKSDPRQPI